MPKEILDDVKRLLYGCPDAGFRSFRVFGQSFDFALRKLLHLATLSGNLPIRVEIIDWYSRKVLAWDISNTMDARFCVEALEPRLSGTANMRYSIRIREARSPPRLSPQCSRRMRFASAWMGGVVGSISRLWSAYGRASTLTSVYSILWRNDFRRWL